MRRLGRRGNIAMLVALLAVPLVGMVGIATDGARAWLLRSRMHTALDAAALAGRATSAWPRAAGCRGRGDVLDQLRRARQRLHAAQATGQAWRGFLDASTTLDAPLAVDSSTMRVSPARCSIPPSPG